LNIKVRKRGGGGHISLKGGRVIKKKTKSPYLEPNSQKGEKEREVLDKKNLNPLFREGILRKTQRRDSGGGARLEKTGDFV